MFCSSQFRNRRLKILISGAAVGIATCLMHIFYNTLSPSESKPLKKQKLLFFKTSGAAGDSLQNIMFRYGESRHLRFALPDKGYEFEKPFLVHRSTETGSYDILVHRVPLIFKRLQKIISLSKSVYITVISHPEDVLRYLFSVYQWDIGQCLQIPETRNVLGHFVESPAKYIKKIFKRKCKIPLPNPTLREFGMPASTNATDEKQTSTVIANIWSHFDIILVAEYLDEGLVLVKDRLGLTFEDMAYVKLGVPSIFKRSRETETLHRQLVARINSGDMKLYNFFVQRHLEQVAKYGEHRMKNDVDKLRKVRQYWHQTCIKALIPFAKLKTKIRQSSHLPTPNTFGYALTDKGKKHPLCWKMVRSETWYTDILRNEIEP